MVLTKLQILAVFLSGLCAGAQGADRPNILLIHVDDLGYGAPGCCNPDSRIATPHIDRLASEGMRFENDEMPVGDWKSFIQEVIQENLIQKTRPS